MNSADCTPLPEIGADALDRMLRLAGVRKTDTLALAGATVADLIGLYRRGYGTVALLTRRPPGPQRFDALVLAAACPLDGVRERLARFGALLRSGGVLLVRADVADVRQAARAAWHLLIVQGFAPLLQVGDGAGLVLLARRDVERRAERAA